ncbi:MAG: choice-of-anchor L domain-containing protein [Dehalococcoidia bacterium]
MKLPKITNMTALVSPRMATWASAVAIFGAGALAASPPVSAATSTADLTTQTATTVAQSLGGAGVTISNVSYIGDPRAAGTFTGAAGSVGFAAGVILSTGNIADSVGPNTAEDVTTNLGEPANWGLPGDADLSTLSGFTTYDATILKFDFVPDSDRVSFRYVFGSEEYNEYVTSATVPSPYNDVFAFFINGVNCATVPGPTGPLPVSINTVNNGNPFGTTPNSNPALYRNNSRTDPGPATIDSEMDGLTVPLTCSATVKPHEINTLRLAIADAADPLYDSVVFIEKGSLSTVEPGAAPDLSVKKELKPGQPTPKAGGNLYYLVRVKNVGTKATPATPANVTLLDTPPAGTSITSWSILTGNGRCSLDGNGRLSCDLGAGMAPGAETVVEVVIRTPKAGTLTNTAEVDPFNRITEIDETNNRTTLATVIP